MGWPVAHSRSPLIHGYWLQQYAIAGTYIPLPVRPEDAASVIRALPMLGLAGANVTVPHKREALSSADVADDVARRIGAANTLVVTDGRVHATNTDAEGFIENLKQGVPGLDFGRGPAVIFGAGGAARAVIVGLLDAGVPRITLLNRTRDRAESLAAELGGGSIAVADWVDRNHALADCTLLVNTTSLGMTGHGPLDIVLDNLPADALVNDIVYAPLETELLAQARMRGNPVVDGLGMLLHQAVAGFEVWFGVRPSVTEELRRLVIADLEGV